MTRRLLFLVALAVLVVPAAALGQQPAVTGRAYVTLGTVFMTASETFDAVADTTRINVVGVGGTVSWQGIFVDVAVSKGTLDGQRVFVLDGEVFDLGIPLEISVRPVDIAGGWRGTTGRLSPYAGAGITFLTYEETDAFADPGDEVSERASGWLLLGGVDVSILPWLHAGGEIRYRAVTGVLGSGGVSEAFGEDSLGGTSVAVRVSVGL